MIQNTSVEKTAELLRQAVEERGADYVYPEEWKTRTSPERPASLCMYVKPDGSGPACIAGYVLYEYGVTLDELVRYEGLTADRVAIDLGVDHESAFILAEAQRLQDNGDTWSDAVRSVMARMRLVESLV